MVARAFCLLILLGFRGWAGWRWFGSLGAGGRLRLGAMAARLFEKIVHSVGEDFILSFAELPVGIQALEFGGGGLGASFAVFFQIENLAGEAGKHREENGVIKGGFPELLLQAWHGELPQNLLRL